MINPTHLSIANRTYLLAINQGNNTLRGRRSHTPRLLRAAILADLALAGAIRDDRGRVAVCSGAPGTLEEVAARVLARIARDKPRKWKDWIERDRNASVDLLEAQLVNTGLVSIRKTTVFLVFPRREITVHDPRLIEQLRERVRHVVFGPEPVASIPEDWAVLAALVTTAGLHEVVGRMEAFGHRKRIRELTSESGPLGPALRRAMQEMDGAMAAIAASSAAVASG